ncbi:MAG: hypothetical protein FJ351_07600, partial [Sphingomonadales bacterium]|nr:hypothetical protein [Sphingomonadales bacterium]
MEGVDLSKPGERERVVAEIKVIEEQRRAAAIARAKELGLPVRIEKPGGGVSEVADIDENGQLLYRTTYNLHAAISTGANLIRQTLPYSLSGNGIKVGVWDGGLVRNTHVEFSTSRVVHMNSTNLLDHATHVAGTIGASGISSSAKGMAPGVAIDSYDWNDDIIEMTSAGAASASDASRIPISNHSYGLTTQTNDAAYMGRYTLDAAKNDALLASAPFYLPFWGAGNDQQRLNAKGGFQSITFEALAKNVLTIGNV